MANTMERKLNRCHLNGENQVISERKIRRQQMIEEEEDLKIKKKGHSSWERNERQDQKRYLEKKHSRNALAEDHLLQIKEKAQKKAEEKERRDLEMSQSQYKLCIQGVKLEKEPKPVVMEIERRKRLDDFFRMKSQREEQEKILRKQEEKTKLDSTKMEGKLLQRKAELPLRSSRHKLFSREVWDQLVSSKMQHAAAAAEREERIFVSGLAKRQAEEAKKRKKEAEKTAGAYQSISAHREKMIQERLQREEAQRQSSADLLKAHKEADRLFLEEKALKAQMTRKEQIELQKFNESLHAKKSLAEQTLAEENYETAIHTLGGRVPLSCEEENSCIPADTALDINGTTKQLDTIQVLTQGDNEMVQLCPTPPPKELRSNSKTSSRVRKLISMPHNAAVKCRLERQHLDRENQEIIQSRIKKQQMVEEEVDRKAVKEGHSALETIMTKDQKRYLQKKHCRNALAEEHLPQIKEKAQKKAQEKEQREMSQSQYKLCIQGVKLEIEPRPVVMKIERRKRLDDISRMKPQREKQEKILRKQEEKTKLDCAEIEGKLLQRKAELPLRSSRHKLFSRSVGNQLVSSKTQQAAATAEREERIFVSGLAQKKAKKAKQRKKEAEKVELCPTPPPKELKFNSKTSSRIRKLISAPLTPAVKRILKRHLLDRENQEIIQSRIKKQQMVEEEKDYETAIHTLGGRVPLSCEEEISCIPADTAATPFINCGTANGKHLLSLEHEDVTKIGQINLSSAFTKLPPISKKRTQPKNI